MKEKRKLSPFKTGDRVAFYEGNMSAAWRRRTGTIQEVDGDLLRAKQQYKFPQEASREYRNKCNLLGAVLASIRKKAALRAKGDWVGGE